MTSLVTCLQIVGLVLSLDKFKVCFGKIFLLLFVVAWLYHFFESVATCLQTSAKLRSPDLRDL